MTQPNYVVYRDGIWEIVGYNESPDEDLRCGWGLDYRPATWRLQYRFGPNNHRSKEIDKVLIEEFRIANELEVLAMAASE